MLDVSKTWQYLLHPLPKKKPNAFANKEVILGNQGVQTSNLIHVSSYQIYILFKYTQNCSKYELIFEWNGSSFHCNVNKMPSSRFSSKVFVLKTTATWPSLSQKRNYCIQRILNEGEKSNESILWYIHYV